MQAYLAVLVVGGLVATSCTQKRAEPSPSHSSPLAEIEMTGELSPVNPVLAYWVFGTPESCDAVSESSKIWGRTPVEKAGNGHFFLEIFVPQNSKGYVCAAGLNAAREVLESGKAVGSPFTFKGEGEVAFSQLKLETHQRTGPFLKAHEALR